MNEVPINKMVYKMTIVPLSEDYISEITNTHFQVFHGYLNTQLGRTYIHNFLRWFSTYEDGFSYVVLDPSGKAVGYLVGASEGYHYQMNKALMFTVFKSLLRNPLLLLNNNLLKVLFNRIKSMFKLEGTNSHNSNLSEPIALLISIGICQSSQGRGYGSAIVRHFEDNVTERGFKSIVLSVYSENLVARKFYEKNGWKSSDQVSSESDAIQYYKNF